MSVAFLAISGLGALVILASTLTSTLASTLTSELCGSIKDVPSAVPKPLSSATLLLCDEDLSTRWPWS